eukprot:gnl/TRDRNA2_/TRDRNA2_143399_c0_seq1.p1 gnl/TRDRNA2_/TRDRNA2_143399_c0~~gnl/TRDRNA2_/TRDRNA2_143399_c0_seq1.p1  ORF type:complete len:233 (-),score=29.48 gnl/TRDRNA2_/TRDRNA2_143399_c0_seq1:272-970(-)
MYSQLLVDGEDSRSGSKARLFKGMALGFGAGLLLGTVLSMVIVPGINTSEPSSLVASTAFSTASQNSVNPLRGSSPVVAHGWRFTHDGKGHPGIGQTVHGMVADAGYAPSYQPSSSAPVPAGQFSPEQLEFMRRSGKLPSLEQPVQQAASAQVSDGQYSPEQLEFMRRAGKMPNSQPQPTSAQGQYSQTQLDFMRRKMEDQYSPPTTSWDSAADDSAGRRDGYRAYHSQRFS